MDTSPTHPAPSSTKPSKPKKQWRAPKSHSSNHTPPPSITPGASGIWATCTKGKEGKATYDLLDLFAEYAAQLYGIHDNIAPAPSPTASQDVAPLPIDPSNPTESAVIPEEDDIETSIAAELSTLKSSSHNNPTSTAAPRKLIQPIRLPTPCLLFFLTSPPLNPILFVQTICLAASTRTSLLPPSRFVKRLTPITLTGRANLPSLIATATTVLSQAGLTAPAAGRTFAIRPTIRNNHSITRDEIIRAVAGLVGKGWKVDLGKPGMVVLVEVWQGVCGVSVVEGGGEGGFEGLKRFNLAELGGVGEGKEGKGEGGDVEEKGEGGGGEILDVDRRDGGGEVDGRNQGDGEGGKRKRDDREDEVERVAKVGRGDEMEMCL